MSAGPENWTRTYIEGREAILGRRLSLSQDPRVAARQLADRIGQREAQRWALQLLRALADRRRSAA